MMAGEAEATVLGTEKNTNADLVADKMSALKLKENVPAASEKTTTTPSAKDEEEEHQDDLEVETAGDGGGAAEADESDEKAGTTTTSATAAAASAATSQDALSTALEFSGGEGSLTIKVQSEDVGRVIGKWGQTIRELQERTGASISLPKGYTKEEFKLVTISGTREQIAHCNALLQLRIAPREDHERIRALQAEARKYEEPMCRTVVNIPITHIGRVIGKGGQTIKHLQDLSGAHIDLPKEYSMEEPNRQVTITGTTYQVSQCQQLLMSIMESPPDRPNIRNLTNCARIAVPDEHVGRVIGKRGAHIKEIQDMSGAIVHLPKSCQPGTNFREVTIYGTPESIHAAQAMLQEKMTPPDHGMEPLRMMGMPWEAQAAAYAGYPSPPMFRHPAFAGYYEDPAQAQAQAQAQQQQQHQQQLPQQAQQQHQQHQQQQQQMLPPHLQGQAPPGQAGAQSPQQQAAMAAMAGMAGMPGMAMPGQPAMYGMPTFDPYAQTMFGSPPNMIAGPLYMPQPAYIQAMYSPPFMRRPPVEMPHMQAIKLPLTEPAFAQLRDTLQELEVRHGVQISVSDTTANGNRELTVSGYDFSVTGCLKQIEARLGLTQ